MRKESQCTDSADDYCAEKEKKKKRRKLRRSTKFFFSWWRPRICILSSFYPLVIKVVSDWASATGSTVRKSWLSSFLSTRLLVYKGDFNFCVRCTILRGSTFRKEKQIKKTVWKKEDFHMMDKIYVAYNFQQITNVFFQAINKWSRHTQTFKRTLFS